MLKQYRIAAYLLSLTIIFILSLAASGCSSLPSTPTPEAISIADTPTPTLEAVEIVVTPVVAIVTNPNSTEVPTGGQVVISAEATGSNLKFLWNTQRGSLSRTEGQSVIYTAPDTPGLDTVDLTVNSDGGISTQSVAFTVVELLTESTEETTQAPTEKPTVTPSPTHTPTLEPSPTLPLVVASPVDCTAQPSSLSPLPASETVLPALRTDQPPTIDGCLDEVVWSQAQPLLYAVHLPANDSTTAMVRLLWDDKYLYAGFDVSDTQVEDSAFEDRWNGDTAGVVIKNNGKLQENRYTIFNNIETGDRAGTTNSQVILTGKTTLNEPNDQDEGYSVEMRIPWAPSTPAEGSIIAADLWSVDHDYNPGRVYTDTNTVFSTISWDGDQKVDTALKSILLSLTSNSTPPPADDTPMLAPTEPDAELGINLGSYIFTSGSDQETGRQEIPIGELEAGQYTPILQNASPEYSQHWFIWDYLALKSGQDVVWEIGNSETPDDYSPTAFDEFCDPQSGKDCIAEFTVGATSVGDFIKELNDGSFPTEKIHFEITDQQAKADLTLVLSTLYSTHEGTENFPNAN